MSDIEKINTILEEVGSPHRVVVGEEMSIAFISLFAALPGYIDKTVREELKRQQPPKSDGAKPDGD